MTQIYKSKKLCTAEEFAGLILNRLIKIDESGDIEYIKTVVEYIFKAKDVNEKDKLLHILTDNLSSTTGDSIMTIAQQLRQEGKQEGIQIGEHNALEAVAKKLLQIDEPLDKIVETTGLSVEEIKKIALTINRLS